MYLFSLGLRVDMHLISLGSGEATLTDNEHLTLLTRNRRQPQFPLPRTLEDVYASPTLRDLCLGP